MGLRPGQKPNHAGRPKGRPNRKTTDLIERAKALGVDPFSILLYMASGNEKGLGYKTPLKKVTEFGLIEIDRITPEMRLKAAAEAAQYLYPKRKAIEHTGAEGEPLNLSPVIILPSNGMELILPDTKKGG